MTTTPASTPTTATTPGDGPAAVLAVVPADAQAAAIAAALAAATPGPWQWRRVCSTVDGVWFPVRRVLMCADAPTGPRATGHARTARACGPSRLSSASRAS